MLGSEAEIVDRYEQLRCMAADVGLSIERDHSLIIVVDSEKPVGGRHAYSTIAEAMAYVDGYADGREMPEDE